MSDNKIIQVSTEIQQLITADQAWHYSIIPKKSENNLLSFYINEEKDLIETKNELEMLFDKNIELEAMPYELISKSLSSYYRKSQKRHDKGNSLLLTEHSEDFLINLITEANDIGSSDIHIESYEEKCRVRMRIDGRLVERYIIKQHDYPALINKIKIKANLDIAEKRLPQDGRIFFTDRAQKFDIRVSILPSLYGEKAVLRLLSKDATNIEVNELGFESTQLKQYLEAIKKQHGIILISGPTGSGKTTTLYATLKILNQENTNITTIEDPIEYTLDGINQVQLKESIGLTFASALRTFLRQDPDIIMLGEIRDAETAQIAIRAALTGHLVLSTIHTNSAWGTITRLIDMGIPAYLLANSIILSAAQRLVRILCPNCKEEVEFEENLYPPGYKQPKSIKTHFLAKGCEQCYYTGYKGRKAIYEIIPVDTDLSEKIRTESTDAHLAFKNRHIMRLSDAAFALFEKGKTSIEEVYSIIMNNV